MMRTDQAPAPPAKTVQVVVDAESKIKNGVPRSGADRDILRLRPAKQIGFRVGRAVV